jgi:hypothetical protein
MLLLYKNAVCPLCKEHHDFCVDEPRSAMIPRIHDFVCPTTGKRTIWHPDVFAHPVGKAPENAIQLMNHVESGQN